MGRKTSQMTELTESQAASGDKAALLDVSVPKMVVMTLANLAKRLLAFITTALAAADVDTASDYLGIYDSSAATTKKITPAALATALGVPKRLALLITQSGTSAPTATVLTNTTGVTPSYARSSACVYTVTATGAFTIGGKTQVKSNDLTDIISLVATSIDVVTITTNDDSVLTARLIEIEIYP